jgi:hypothetical protein
MPNTEIAKHFWRGGSYVDCCWIHVDNVKIGDLPMMQWAIQAMDPFQPENLKTQKGKK